MVHFWGVSIIIDSTDYDSTVICTIYGVINIKICTEHIGWCMCVGVCMCVVKSFYFFRKWPVLSSPNIFPSLCLTVLVLVFVIEYVSTLTCILVAFITSLQVTDLSIVFCLVHTLLPRFSFSCFVFSVQVY